MAETKFNTQQMDRPAPLWYRRFSNVMVTLVIPAASAFIESWGMSDLTENRVLHSLIFLAAIIKGVGVFLGNGQSYTDKIAIGIILVMLFTSCSSPRKAAEKEHAYIQQLQQKYANNTAASVILTVPGGLLHLTDTTPCPDFHNSEVSSKGGVLTVNKSCPPVSINADSLVRNSDLYKAAILARRNAEIEADTNKEALYKSQGALQQAQNSARIGWGLAIGFTIIGAVLGAFKIFK